MIWLTGTAYPHRYWGYDSRVLRIWLTGTEDMTHRYWGYDSRVLRIWLTGTAYPHGYWRYDSRVLHTLTGSEDMTHRYWWYDSRVMHILTGTAYSLYRVQLEKTHLSRFSCKNCCSIYENAPLIFKGVHLLQTTTLKMMWLCLLPEKTLFCFLINWISQPRKSGSRGSDPQKTNWRILHVWKLVPWYTGTLLSYFSLRELKLKK